MSFRRAVKRQLRAAVLPVLFSGLCAYFIWNAQHGDYGTMAREKKLEDLATARTTLARVEAERDTMERRVGSLRGEQLDRDQLDERARQLLNLFSRDEIIVPLERR